jgi:hypothetical protein
MVLIVIESWYPAKIAALAGQKYIEVTQKYPPDESLGEVALDPILRVTKDGIHAIYAWKCKDDKVKDSLMMLSKAMFMYADLEGYQYSIETYVDLTEAYAIIGAKGP